MIPSRGLMLTGVGVEGRFVDDGELLERKIWSEERDDEVVVKRFQSGLALSLKIPLSSLS